MPLPSRHQCPNNPTNVNSSTHQTIYTPHHVNTYLRFAKKKINLSRCRYDRYSKRPFRKGIIYLHPLGRAPKSSPGHPRFTGTTGRTTPSFQHVLAHAHFVSGYPPPRVSSRLPSGQHQAKFRAVLVLMFITARTTPPHMEASAIEILQATDAARSRG